MSGRGVKNYWYWLLAIVLISQSLFITSAAKAANITDARAILSRMKASTPTDVTIEFITPTGYAVAGNAFTLTFPSGWTMGTFNVNNFDLAAATNCTSSFTDRSLATSAAADTWGVGQSGQVITFTPPTSGSGAITNGHCVQVEIGSHATNQAAGVTQMTTHATPAAYTISVGGDDTGDMLVRIVAEDQVAVTATVDQTLACTTSSTATMSFGTFSLETVTTATNPPTWTISTNAANGYVLTVRGTGNGTNGGLNKTTTPSYIIGSANNSFAATQNLATAGIIGYGAQGSKTDGDAGSSATSIASDYNQGSDIVGRVRPVALSSFDTFASAGGPVANATVTMNLKARISGLVPAGAYEDTITFVCAARF